MNGRRLAAIVAVALVLAHAAPVLVVLVAAELVALAVGLVALGWLLAVSRPGTAPAWAGTAGRR